MSAEGDATAAGAPAGRERTPVAVSAAGKTASGPRDGISGTSVVAPGVAETVSVVIVLWNCEPFLVPCLGSLRAQSLAPAEVVAVDNASADGSADLFAREMPGATLIRNAENAGFAAASNQGIRSSRGRYVLCLNPDVVLRPDYIAHLLAGLRAGGPWVGWATGKLLKLVDGAETAIIDSTGHFLTRARHPWNRGWGQPDSGQFDDETRVFGSCAAATLYRRVMLDEARLGDDYFDVDFRSYFEDADLDWRAALAGWRCLYVPEAVAFHARGGTGGQRLARVKRDMIKNHILMMVKNDLPGLALRDLPFLGLYWLKVAGQSVVSPALIPGWLEAVRLLPSAFRKRRVVQSRRVVSRDRVKTWFRDVPLGAKLMRKRNAACS